MKKLILRTILLFFISTFVIYSFLTFLKFQNWCNTYDVKLGYNVDPHNLDKLKLEGLGNFVDNISKLATQEEQLNQYNTTGYAVWLKLQSSVSEIMNYYFHISLLLGISTAIAYFIFNINKLNIFLKILLGYILPIIAISLIYVLIFNNAENPFMDTRDRTANIILFCIIFTIMAISILIYKKIKLYINYHLKGN